MLKALCQRVFGLASVFLAAQQGSILIYTGAFMAIGVGGASLSIDIGRIVLLRTQMQNRADAGALAGAAQLDAQDNAVVRAETVVRESMSAFTTVIADQSELAVLDVTIHEANADRITRNPLETTNDGLARFVVVTLERRTLSFFYGPASAVLAGQDADNTAQLDARAVAMSDPYICKAQPMLICDPYDLGNGTSSQQLVTTTYEDNIGKQITLKPPSTTATDDIGSGNFGLLALPDDTGGVGANAIEKALAADEPEGCYGINQVTTASGSMVNKVASGINTRFGYTAPGIPDPLPAPNVINYPKDNNGTGTDVFGNATPPLMGSGIWDYAGYWSARHSGVDEPSTVANTNFPATPSRYQVYLFELKEIFYVKPGKKTASTQVQDISVGGGWKKVDPLATHPTGAVVPTNISDPSNGWVDGIGDAGSPSTVGQARRLLRLALIRCVSENLTGKSTIPNSERYVELFLTQEVVKPGKTDLGDGTAGGGVIFGEIVRALAPQTSLEFHGNVRLVE